MSAPVLPFVEFATELRFVVLKAMLPRGEVKSDCYFVTSDGLALCVKRNGEWCLTRGEEPSRTGSDLLALAENYFGARRGVVAVRLLEAATGITVYRPHEFG